MQISEIVDAMIELINLDLIAKTNLTADVMPGDTTISVINSFHFKKNQEIILIDWGYNDPDSPHYQKFEYAVVKSVQDTKTITLKTPVISTWLLADKSFIQKTIGHSPLYTQNVLYGDREVIPTDEIAITVEPVSLSNEWIYLQGGLSEENRITLYVYGQEVKTEDGMRILNKYTEALYQLLNDSMHFNINDEQAPLVGDVIVGDTQVCVANTEENRDTFVLSDNGEQYSFQDNLTPRCNQYCVTDITFEDCKMCLTLNRPIEDDFTMDEFAVITKYNRYVYDSRVDNVTWGQTQKGSSVLRAAELSWFGKEVNDHAFPQADKKVICFDEQDGDCSSSSSSD
jgi:hypothetical protein